MYDESIPQLSKMMDNLCAWLDEAEQTAADAGYDANKLTVAWLAPDQFDLCRNAQAACDGAKLTGARLAGIDAPVHEDGPASLEQLRTRAREVRAFLDGLDKDTVDGRADAWLSPGFLRGARVRAQDYVREFGLPNTYFHLAMVYAILRHNGVKLGKRTWLGRVSVVPAADSGSEAR